MNNHSYVVAVDQGTTSTRCVVVDEDGAVVSSGQLEHRQILPAAGWVEHDPLEIWQNTRRAIADALAEADIARGQISAFGLANQRETTVVWDRYTGRPVGNAIVWQDTRTEQICEALAGEAGPGRWREKTGLLINSYSSGPKLRWILDNVPEAQERAERGELLFGTIDSWLVWNLTGGARGDHGRPALHVTDVTNASRTLMMNVRTLDWDDEILGELGIPRRMLPEIRPSVGEFGRLRGRDVLGGVPIGAVLGDQQSAMIGQGCLGEGDAKNTYGTGLFLLQNTGTTPTWSRHGLITTVCYQVAGEKPVYALEGSVSMGGALVQWLRDNLGILSSAAESESLARGAADNGGVYIVPAFSGLFAPRWRPDARGVIVGLTGYANKHHLARAVLEATAYQTKEVVDAMCADSGVPIGQLRADGGMTDNDLLMQFQADLLGIPVVRPADNGTTVLGAAYAAGFAVGYWPSLTAPRDGEPTTWHPAMPSAEAERLFADWNRAVERSYAWQPTAGG